jgi:hypothetical protein
MRVSATQDEERSRMELVKTGVSLSFLSLLVSVACVREKPRRDEPTPGPPAAIVDNFEPMSSRPAPLEEREIAAFAAAVQALVGPPGSLGTDADSAQASPGFPNSSDPNARDGLCLGVGAHFREPFATGTRPFSPDEVVK